MQSTTVRLASPVDLPAVATLRRAWTEETAGGSIDDPGFERRLADWYQRQGAQRLVWLGELGGKTVGMLNLQVFERMPRPGRDGGSWGYIANAFVLATFRNLGIGRQLLDAAIQHAREHRFSRLVLNPSTRSVPFYVRAGFAASSLLQLSLP
jgi:GNAT superfamily N-acetyltransferase